MVRASMIRAAPNTITLEPDDSLLRRGCSKLALLWLLDGATMLYQLPDLLTVRQTCATNDVSTNDGIATACG
jgi:hypothetical protein